MKKILFLGNSFTYYNDLPAIVERLSCGELECHSITRGGAYLNAYKTPSDELRGRLDELLSEHQYDYVVLQEQSLNAITDLGDYLSSVKNIASLVGNTKILLYQTWSYAEGSKILKRAGLSYAEMADGLENAVSRAAREIGAQVIPVGRVFANVCKHRPEIALYDDDGLHPSERGSFIAACVFARFLCEKISGEIPLWIREYDNKFYGVEL